MSSKVTAQAPANIAFIKYWGTRDAERTIPSNRSISMTLSRCHTRSTVEYRPRPGPDEILVRDSEGKLGAAPEPFVRRVVAHLHTLRRAAGSPGSFRIATENNFPAGAGLASSASGFAALTLAATSALGLALGPRELSSLTRRSGSGSAARSTLGGFVEWPAGFDDEEAYAVQLAPAEHWDLCDVVALVDLEEKSVSSLEGHSRAPTSPYFKTRLGALEDRLEAVRGAIRSRSLEQLGPLLEEEAIDLHLIAMSSRPPIFYWKPATLLVLDGVRRLREEGIAAFATLDAGPNVHVVCASADEEAVAQKLAALDGVKQVIRDRVGPGPCLLDEHLF